MPTNHIDLDELENAHHTTLIAWFISHDPWLCCGHPHEAPQARCRRYLKLDQPQLSQNNVAQAMWQCEEAKTVGDADNTKKAEARTRVEGKGGGIRRKRRVVPLRSTSSRPKTGPLSASPSVYQTIADT